jgi:hypothetical protein
MSVRARKPKQLGVYVPPPRETSRPLDQRIAELKSRSTPKMFLDAPRPDEREGSLARLLGTTDEDWTRRRAEHLEFLETTESLGIAEAFYEVRNYIQNRPYECAGRWEEAWIDDRDEVHPAQWVFEPRAVDYLRAVEKTREHLIEVFRKVLKDAVCPHGEPWDNWRPHFSWDKSGSAGCAQCFLAYELKQNNMNPELANFPDAKLLESGNTKCANTILNLLNLGKWREQDKKHEKTFGSEKLDRIDGAKQCDALIGGKRVKPKGAAADKESKE